MSDKPGATQSEFNVDQAQCQLAAKASEGGSAAAGDPKGSLFRMIGRRTGD
jgi:hypothetical protein